MTKERRLDSHDITEMVMRANEKKQGRYPADWDGIFVCAWMVGVSIAVIVGVWVWYWVNS